MDTTDTTTDLVIIDAEIVEDDTDSVANSVGKTLAATAASSAIVLGVVLAYKFAAPKVASWILRSKTDEPAETVEVPTETPETAEV